MDGLGSRVHNYGTMDHLCVGEWKRCSNMGARNIAKLISLLCSDFRGDGSDTLSEAGSTKAMSRTSITDSADIESEEEMKKAVKVVDSMLTKMYFC